MADVKELREYKYWVGKNPAQIRKAVIEAGGWVSIFPVQEGKAFPEWASRIRNYFNETPKTLKLLTTEQATTQTGAIKDRKSTFIGNRALSGTVYEDENHRMWFEMSTGGTVYHYPGEVTFFKKVGAAAASKKDIPIFKLVSPDGTGGSMELCVLNPQTKEVKGFWGTTHEGESAIGKEGVPASIIDRTEVDKIYRGSYNYAETILRGLDEHDYMDIKPHKEEADFYINPADLYSTIDTRIFPAKDDQGKALVPDEKPATGDKSTTPSR